MATTTSNYSTLTTQLGTLTNSDGLFRPDAGLASSAFFIGQLDILPQLDLPGNAVAPLTGLEVLIDSASAGTNVNNAILIQIFSGSISFPDKGNLGDGNLDITTTPTSYTLGSSSLAGGVWKDGSNRDFKTGSAAITRISSASSSTNKLKLSMFLNGGGQTISLNNLRVRLTYTPATSLSTQMKRATGVISNTGNIQAVGFINPVNILDSQQGDATSNESGSVIVLRYPSFDIPASASIIGYQFQGKGKNEGSGSIPTFGDTVMSVEIGTGSTFGTLNDFTFASGDEGALKDIGFGGSTDLQGLDLTPAQANDLSVRFTYKSTATPTSSLAIVGDAESTFPGLRVYFSNTDPSSFSKVELLARIDGKQDFEPGDDVVFTLANDLDSTAYFNIEGKNRKEIFSSASLLSLTNCSVVSESFHAGFIVNPGSASFVLNHNDSSGIKIAKEDIQFVAANAPSGGLARGIDIALA
jgi:hypothetical protein